jgi:hypothetical protein
VLLFSYLQTDGCNFVISRKIYIFSHRAYQYFYYVRQLLHVSALSIGHHQAVQNICMYIAKCYLRARKFTCTIFSSLDVAAIEDNE